MMCQQELQLCCCNNAALFCCSSSAGAATELLLLVARHALLLCVLAQRLLSRSVFASRQGSIIGWKCNCHGNAGRQMRLHSPAFVVVLQRVGVHVQMPVQQLCHTSTADQPECLLHMSVEVQMCTAAALLCLPAGVTRAGYWLRDRVAP